MPTSQPISALGGCETWQRGPFQIGSNLYTVSNFNNEPQMYKSIDAGSTWTLMDVQTTAQVLDTSPTASTDGTKIFCCYGRRVAGITHVAFRIFDTGSDTWGTEIVTSNLGSATAGEDPVYTSAYRPSDGQVLVCSGVIAFSVGVNFRQGFFLFDVTTHTFTAWIACGYTVVDATQVLNMGIVTGTGPSDLWITFQVSPTPWKQPGTIPFMVQQIIGSAPQTLITIDTFVTTIGMTGLAPASDNATWCFAWTDDTTFIRVMKNTAGTTAGMVVQTVTPPGNVHSWALAVIPAGILLIVNYNAGGTNPLIYYLDSGAGFGAPTTLLTDIGNNVGGFGLIVTPNATVLGFGAACAFNGTVGTFEYSYLFFGSSPTPATGPMFLSGNLPVHPIPATNVCKFERVTRHNPQGKILQSGKMLVFPDGYTGHA